jgi:4-carboxymuconolactone decarboxylase
MPLIGLVDEAAAPPEIREALAAMPPQGSVYRLIAHAQTAFRPFLTLAGKLQTSLELDARLRQLAILRVAVLADCEYERVQHEVIAGIEGVRDDQVQALRAGRADGPEFDELETLVLRFATEVVEGLGASEATTRELAAQLPERDLVELLLVISQYLGLAALLKTARLEPVAPMDPQEIFQARARRAALSESGQ